MNRPEAVHIFCMRDRAARGVSEATVLTYFGSKRELCVEVIRQWYGQITAEQEAQLPAIGGGLGNQLQFIVRKRLDNLMGEGAGIRVGAQ